MKTHLGRVALVAAAFAIVGATASVAHDPTQDLARRQREIEELRAERSRLQDQTLELARRFDTEKRRLQIQLESAHKQIAWLETRVGAVDPGSPAATLLSRKVTVSFTATPLEEVRAFLQETTKVTVHGESPEDLSVTLRARDLPLRDVLDLIAGNARDEAGEWVELEWGHTDDELLYLRRQ